MVKSCLEDSSALFFTHAKFQESQTAISQCRKTFIWYAYNACIFLFTLLFTRHISRKFTEISALPLFWIIVKTRMLRMHTKGSIIIIKGPLACFNL